MERARTTDLAGEALREPRHSSSRHAALFERVAERIYAFFVKSAWDRGEAEELTQRTLFELERSLREGTYDPGRSFNTWMWLKAHTIYAQWCRERARRPGAIEEAAEEELPRAPSHEAAVDAKVDAAALLRAVQRKLGEETYEMLALTYEGGLTQAEVAEAVGCDRKTVGLRLREAHALIETLARREPS